MAFKKVLRKIIDKDLLCPRCLSYGDYIVMNKAKKAGITVDKCPECGGFYLDKGEQKKLLKHMVKLNKQKKEAKR